jgi:signal transduction histidine kinase
MILFVFWFQNDISVFAQKIENQDYFIRQFTDESGLPQNSVKAIMNDENGFVWLTTEDGLARFDGQRFLIFNKNNVNISSNRFREFVPALVNNPKSEFNFRARCSTGENVSPQKNGTAAVDEHYFPDNFSGYEFVKKYGDTCDFLQNQHPKSFLGQGHKPLLIVGTNANMFVWTNDSVHYYRNGAALGGTAGVYKNVFVTDSNLYGVTANGRFERTIVGAAPEVVKLKGDITSDKSFIRNPSGFDLYWSQVTRQAFIAIEDRLYFIEEKGHSLTTTLLITDLNIPDKEIVAVLYDRNSKAILLGSSTIGFFVCIRKQFQHILSPQPSDDNVFYAQIAFSDDAILTAQGSVLTNTPGKTYSPAHFYDKTARRRSNVYYLAQAKDSTFWIRVSKTVFQYDKSGRHILNKHDFNEEIKALALDEYGILWIGGEIDRLYSLNTMDPKAVPALVAKAAIGEITQIVRRSPAYLLLGTKKGLYQYELKSRHLLSLRDFAHADIRSILISGEDIWISTYGDGIFLWSRGKISKFPLDNNNFLATSHCMTEDNKGFFWITTNKGLFQVAKNDLLQFANNNQKPVYYLYYDKYNGFTSNEFNGGCQPCSVKMADGTLSLPSINGLVWFKPDSMQVELPNKEIFISHIELDGRNVSQEALLKIPRKFRRLRISVSSPYFGSANNLQYDYAIQSKNTPPVWLPIIDNFTLEVPNTASGNYSLLIRKHAGFGASNYSYRKVDLYIVPAWYETIVFKGLLVLAVVLVLWQLLKLRETYMIKKERRKNLYRHYHISNQIVAAINHDIQTPLHYISNSVLQMKDYLDKNLIQNDFITKISEETVNTIGRTRVHTNNLVNYLKSQNKAGAFAVEMQKIDIHEVVSTSCQLLSGTINYREITLSNQIPKPFYVMSDVKLLSVIVHNIIDNAVKLSDSSVTITSGITDSQPYILVTDNASGMPDDILQWLNKKYSSYGEWIRNNEYPDSRGLGIIMVKDLTTLLKIHLHVSSVPGTGSAVRLTFPAPKDLAQHELPM